MSTAAGKRIYIEDLSEELAALTATVNDNTSDLASVMSGFGVEGISCELFSEGIDTYTSGVEQPVGFGPGTESNDDNGFHSETTNPTRITVPTGLTGRYLMGYTVPWGGGTAGDAEAWIRINGDPIDRGATVLPISTGPCVFTAITFMQLNAGDYLELYAKQNTGFDRIMDGSGGRKIKFYVARLGK